MPAAIQRWLVFCAVLVVGLAASSAPGQGFNLSFESPNAPPLAPPPASFGGAASQPGVWNAINPFATPVALLDLNGAASPVVLSRFTPGTLDHQAFNSPLTSGNREALLDDWWGPNAPGTIMISNLAPGWYEVITYAINTGNPATNTLVNIPGAVQLPFQRGGGPVPPSGFTLGTTHTRHRVLVSGAPLNIQIDPTGPLSPVVNGMQIKPAGPCPEVRFVAPTDLSCVCSNVDVYGDVNVATPGTLAYWYLEYRPLNSTTWTLINFGFTGGTNIFLGTFNTMGLLQGHYYLRLTAVSGDECSNNEPLLVFVDKQFDTVEVSSPLAGQVYGGRVCVNGIVNDSCIDNFRVLYAPPPFALFFPVDPLVPQYAYNVPINAALAIWDTRTGGAAVPDGPHRVRVVGADRCGFSKSVSRDITIDNTAPQAVITSPTNCSYVSCISVPIVGTVCDTHLDSWIIEVTGGPYTDWHTIATGNTCITNGLLTTWNTTGLPLCPYTIRLRVFDRAIVDCGVSRNVSEAKVSVIVGLAADANGDGVVNFADITAVLVNFGMTCFL